MPKREREQSYPGNLIDERCGAGGGIAESEDVTGRHVCDRSGPGELMTDGALELELLYTGAPPQTSLFHLQRISTRRLSDRPLSSLFVAIGRLSPRPAAVTRAAREPAPDEIGDHGLRPPLRQPEVVVVGPFARRVAFDDDAAADIVRQSLDTAARAPGSDSGRISAESKSKLMPWMIEPQPSAGGAGCAALDPPSPVGAVVDGVVAERTAVVERTPRMLPSAATLRMNALGVLSKRSTPVARRMLPVTVPVRSPLPVVASRHHGALLLQAEPQRLRPPAAVEMIDRLRHVSCVPLPMISLNSKNICGRMTLMPPTSRTFTQRTGRFARRAASR